MKILRLQAVQDDGTLGAMMDVLVKEFEHLGIRPDRARMLADRVVTLLRQPYTRMPDWRMLTSWWQRNVMPTKQTAEELGWRWLVCMRRVAEIAGLPHKWMDDYIVTNTGDWASIGVLLADELEHLALLQRRA